MRLLRRFGLKRVPKHHAANVIVHKGREASPASFFTNAVLKEGAVPAAHQSRDLFVDANQTVCRHEVMDSRPGWKGYRASMYITR